MKGSNENKRPNSVKERPSLEQTMKMVKDIFKNIEAKIVFEKIYPIPNDIVSVYLLAYIPNTAFVCISSFVFYIFRPYKDRFCFQFFSSFGPTDIKIFKEALGYERSSGYGFPTIEFKKDFHWGKYERFECWKEEAENWLMDFLKKYRNCLHDSFRDDDDHCFLAPLMGVEDKRYPRFVEKLAKLLPKNLFKPMDFEQNKK